MPEIEERLKKLPILPDKVNQLFHIKTDNSYDSKRLQIIIQSDATLISRLLQLSNSTYFGFLHPVYTPSRAVSLYGFNFTIAICIVEVIFNSLKFDLNAYDIGYLEFKKNLDTSFKILFDLLDESEAHLKEELILPLFLQHIGKFLISDYLIKKGRSYSFKGLLKEVNINTAEKEFAHYSSNELSSMILSKWNFPKKVIEIISNIGNGFLIERYNKEINTLTVINLLCDLKKPFDESNIRLALKYSSEFGLDTVKLKKIIEKMKIEYKKY